MKQSENKPTTEYKSAKTRSAVMPNQIKTGLPVMCANDVQLGVVDHMQGADAIKLNKDEKGVHHFIPLGWVRTVDTSLHLDRPGEQAMKEWSVEAPRAR